MMSAREVRPDAPSLRLGDGDFTICARVYTAEALGGPVGDIACQYDHQRRRGFHFGVINHHPYFGTDAGGKRCAWLASGRRGGLGRRAPEEAGSGRLHFMLHIIGR